MAKSFYNLEEAAAKLGLSPEQVTELAQQNKLQQYRNGDKLMFKVDQVDAMANSGGQDDSMGPIALADSGDTDGITLSDESTAGKTDAINLADATDVADSPASSSSGSGSKAGTGSGSKSGDSRQATGVSVFDADEVEHADPAAQTHVTHPTSAEEELALESVGSGSGLLDLTRESDDTSLGAELLDEIYPGGADGTSAGGSKVDSASGASGTGTGPPGSSGVFDGAIQMESGPSGLENISQASTDLGMMAMPVVEEESDPAWSSAVGFALAGVCLTLLVGLMAVIAGLMEVRGPLIKTFQSTGALMGLCIALLVISIALGAAGFFIGPAMASKR